MCMLTTSEFQKVETPEACWVIRHRSYQIKLLRSVRSFEFLRLYKGFVALFTHLESPHKDNPLWVPGETQRIDPNKISLRIPIGSELGSGVFHVFTDLLTAEGALTEMRFNNPGLHEDFAIYNAVGSGYKIDGKLHKFSDNFNGMDCAGFTELKILTQIDIPVDDSIDCVLMLEILLDVKVKRSHIMGTLRSAFKSCNVKIELYKEHPCKYDMNYIAQIKVPRVRLDEVLTIIQDLQLQVKLYIEVENRNTKNWKKLRQFNRIL